MWTSIFRLLKYLEKFPALKDVLLDHKHNGTPKLNAFVDVGMRQSDRANPGIVGRNCLQSGSAWQNVDFWGKEIWYGVIIWYDMIIFKNKFKKKTLVSYPVDIGNGDQLGPIFIYVYVGLVKLKLWWHMIVSASGGRLRVDGNTLRLSSNYVASTCTGTRYAWNRVFWYIRSDVFV